MNSKLTFSAAVAIGSLLGIGAASAADLPTRPVYTKAPTHVAPQISWTGCYIGGNVGGGWTKLNAGGVAFAGVPVPFVDYGG
jgi:outer membrane immunogenic protein